MCIIVSKSFVVSGLIISLIGLILMIYARRKEGFDNYHVKIKPKQESWAWLLTILGYLFQVVGVVIA
jgi:hypothetical protein